MATPSTRNILGQSMATSPGNSPLERALAGDEVYYHYKPAAKDIKKHGPAYAASVAMLKAQDKLNKKMIDWKIEAATEAMAKLSETPKPPKVKKPKKETHIDVSVPTYGSESKTAATPPPQPIPSLLPPSITEMVAKVKPSKMHLTADAPHEKTQKLREQLAAQKKTNEEMAKEEATNPWWPHGGKPKGLDKIGSFLGAGARKAGGVTGDIVGTAIDYLGRPAAAIGGGIGQALNEANTADTKEGQDPGYPHFNWGHVGSAALAGLEGKAHPSFIPLATETLQKRHPELKPAKNDNLAQKILKAAPGVGLGLTSDIATDPFTHGVGSINAVERGLKAPEEISRVSEAARVEEALLHTSPALEDLRKQEGVLAQLEEARRADKASVKLATVQKANRDLNALRTKLAPVIKADAVKAGFTFEEINSLNLEKSVAARALELAHPAPGSITKTPHMAAGEIIDELAKTKSKITPAERTALVGKKALEFEKERAVQEEAAATTLDKINASARAGFPIGSAEKEKIFQESVAEISGDRARETRRLLDEALTKRFSIGGLEGAAKRVPAIEKSLRALYVPFEKSNAVFKGTEFGQHFTKGFSMKAHFHESSEEIRRITEQHGILEAGQHNDEVRRVFKGVSNVDKETITHAIEAGHDLAANPRLEALRQYATDQIDQNFQKLMSIGKYKKADQVKNYIFHHYRGGTTDKIQAFKKDRLEALRAGRRGPTLEEAASQGFRPEKRIDEILLHNHMDMSRKLQRANFRQQIMSKFGVLTDNPHHAVELGLKEMKPDKLNKMFDDLAKAKGKDFKWYLPPELHDTFQAFDKMLSAVGVSDGRELLSYFDRILRGFKTSATIGNVGNWVNNTAGDLFLNWVDGVKNPAWYKRSAQMLRTHGEEGVRTIRLAGKDYKADEILRLFKEKAPTGGFIRTEGGRLSESKFIPGGARIHAAVGHVQGAYETREEWGRLAHFLHAMDEELPKSRNIADAAEKSAKRVAKWNIDYTAITPLERKIRKHFVPFYTFMRKATPLMLESIATRPGKVLHYGMAENAISRLMGQPPVGQDTNQTNWPGFAKQAGGIRIGGGAEPIQLRDISPLQTLNRLGAGKNPSDIVGNIVNQMNPLGKIPVEVAMQRSLFNRQPITNWPAYFANQVPTISQVTRLANHPLKLSDTNTPPKGAAMSVLNFLGIPVTKVTENQQQSELHQQLAAQPKTLKKANETLAVANLKISKHSSSKLGTYYTVTDRSGDKPVILGRYRDPVTALEVASGKMLGRTP